MHDEKQSKLTGLVVLSVLIIGGVMSLGAAWLLPRASSVICQFGEQSSAQIDAKYYLFTVDRKVIDGVSPTCAAFASMAKEAGSAVSLDASAEDAMTEERVRLALFVAGTVYVLNIAVGVLSMFADYKHVIVLFGITLAFLLSMVTMGGIWYVDSSTGLSATESIVASKLPGGASWLLTCICFLVPSVLMMAYYLHASLHGRSGYQKLPSWGSLSDWQPNVISTWAFTRDTPSEKSSESAGSSYHSSDSSDEFRDGLTRRK